MKTRLVGDVEQILQYEEVEVYLDATECLQRLNLHCLKKEEDAVDFLRL